MKINSGIFTAVVAGVMLSVAAHLPAARSASEANPAKHYSPYAGRDFPPPEPRSAEALELWELLVRQGRR